MNVKKNSLMMEESFAFPVGYHEFHKDKHLNYHLNRWNSMGYWTKNEATQATAGASGRDELKGALRPITSSANGCI